VSALSLTSKIGKDVMFYRKALKSTDFIMK